MEFPSARPAPFGKITTEFVTGCSSLLSFLLRTVGVAQSRHFRAEY